MVGLALLLGGSTQAAEIDVTFDDVPTNVVCGQTWTNNNVILNFGETVDGEGVTTGDCYFEADPGYVWIYPGRLVVNFSLLTQSVTGIVVDVNYEVSGLFAYQGTNQIAQVGNSYSGTLSLNFTNGYPDYCAISGYEAVITGITLYTLDAPPPQLSIEQTNGVITVFWPTNASMYVLESNSDLTNSSGWTAQTNNIQIDGTNFYYTVAVPAAQEFFRLEQ